MPYHIREHFKMREIQVPDDVYRQAAEAAKASRVTVEQFVAEAVTVYAQGDPADFFNPRIVDEIKKAAAEARGGNNISLEEHSAEMKNLRAAWQENRPA